jgi:hypothetical protein
MVEFEKVIDGIVKYIDVELLPKMNSLQDFTARVLIGRIINNTETLKNTLVNNGYIRTFGIVDSDGLIDVEGLAEDIKKEISRKGEISLEIPLIGKLTFVPTDVDVLHRMICRGENNNDYN